MTPPTPKCQGGPLRRMEVSAGAWYGRCWGAGMLRRLCQWVPCVLFAAWVGGCSCGMTHGLDDDAGIRPDAGGPSDYLCECPCGRSGLTSGPDACGLLCATLCEGPDGGPWRDADLALDAGSCGPRPIEVVCFDHVREGQETTVEVTLDPAGEDCFCGQEITCAPERAGASSVLALQTALCPETPICRACESAPVGSCTLPPLAAGPMRVRINGQDAFDLDVTPADVLPERADVCVRTAQIDSCGAVFTPELLGSDRACHASWVPTGTRVPIRVEDACGGCQQIGPCTVTVLDSTILVRPTRLPNSCDIACDPVCDHTEHLCVTPPLRDGRYTVMVQGLTVTDDGPPSTIEVSASGGVAVEECRGSR